MTNNKQQTAVHSIIEFCQKQMENDSSIHKGVYLSIIKFCKEQITEESEIHWKTTLLMMTNNKQTSIDWFFDQLVLNRIIVNNSSTYWDKVKTKYQIILEQAKETLKCQPTN